MSHPVNLQGRHLSESQRAMIGAKILPMLEVKAHDRKGGSNQHKANLPDADKRQARDEAAQLVNVSPRHTEVASLPAPVADDLLDAAEREGAAP